VTEGSGGPLGIVVAGANVVDAQLLKATLEAIVVERPADVEQNLCLDKGYDNPTAREALASFDYIPHIRPIGEAPPKQSRRKYPPRRWVVERTFAWLSKCRALLVRYDKKAQNYLGLLQLACALLWYRRVAAASAKTK
jgi:putative transposase